MSSARVQIDLGALQHNLGVCRQLTGKANVFGVVKANAYGHGLLRCSQALTSAANPVDGLAVARLDEAVSLRDAGTQGPILLLSGVHDGAALLEAQRQRLSLVVHSQQQVELLLQNQALAPFNLWLKVDSGMHRLGLPPEQIPKVLERLQSSRMTSRPVGLLTHLASADELASSATATQKACFDGVDWAGGARSMANSAAVLAWPNSYYQWVRPGVMLYGVSPFAGESGVQRGLRPVMEFSAPVIAIREQDAGDRIGYGGAGQCERATKIAVLAAGYGDGYPRHARQSTPVWLGGARCPLLGRVSMDLITVDITDASGVAVGDWATLWGSALPVEEVASHADTIAYELLTRVSPRPGLSYLEPTSGVLDGQA